MARSLMNADYFEIGWFQIENLLLNQMKFTLFDLSSESRRPVEPKAFWAQALKVLPHQVLVAAQNQLQSPEQPLLLLCLDGKTSSRAALELTKAGYRNLFVIEGGYQKLLSDLERSTNF